MKLQLAIVALISGASLGLAPEPEGTLSLESESGRAFVFREQFFIAGSEFEIPSGLRNLAVGKWNPSNLRKLDPTSIKGGFRKNARLISWDESILVESQSGSYHLLLTPELDGVIAVENGQFRVFSPGQSGLDYPDAIALGVPQWRTAIRGRVGNQKGKAVADGFTFHYADTDLIYCRVSVGSNPGDWNATFFSKTGEKIASYSRAHTSAQTWLLLEARFLGGELEHINLRSVKLEDAAVGETVLRELVAETAKRYSLGMYVLDTRVAGELFYWAEDWEDVKCAVSDHF